MSDSQKIQRELNKLVKKKLGKTIKSGSPQLNYTPRMKPSREAGGVGGGGGAFGFLLHTPNISALASASYFITHWYFSELPFTDHKYNIIFNESKSTKNVSFSIEILSYTAIINPLSGLHITKLIMCMMKLISQAK